MPNNVLTAAGPMIGAQQSEDEVDDNKISVTINQNEENMRTITLPRVHPSHPSSHHKAHPNAVSNAKYTAHTFFPKALALQFRRVANVYFLCVVIIMLLGYKSSLFKSPLPPWGTLFTLVIIVSLNMIIEFRDDLARRREDEFVNKQNAKRLSHDGSVESETTWEQLAPGDIVLVAENETIPADMVLVKVTTKKDDIDRASSNEQDDQQCFVETSQIDGETNLKPRFALGGPWQDEQNNTSSYAWMTGTLHVPLPSPMLSFNGEFESERQQQKITMDNILLRGSVLCNTTSILGVVVYAGSDTKMLQAKPNNVQKVSRLESLINSLLFTVLIAFLAVVVITTLFEIRMNHWLLKQWYFAGASAAKESILPPLIASLFGSIILYKNMLPILLYVATEVTSTYMARHINRDEDMVDNGVYARCRTTGLVHELGQVQWLFSDKTGTLTENKMRLVGLWVAARTAVTNSPADGSEHKVKGNGGQAYGVKNQADLGAIASAEEQSLASAQVLLRHQQQHIGGIFNNSGFNASPAFHSDSSSLSQSPGTQSVRKTHNRNESNEEEPVLPSVAIAQTTRNLFHNLLTDVSRCNGAGGEGEVTEKSVESLVGNETGLNGDTKTWTQSSELEEETKATRGSPDHEQLLDMMTALALCHTVVAHQYRSDESEMHSSSNMTFNIQRSGGLRSSTNFGLNIENEGNIDVSIEPDMPDVADVPVSLVRPGLRRHSLSLSKRIISVRALAHLLDDPENSMGYYSEPMLVEEGEEGSNATMLEDEEDDDQTDVDESEVSDTAGKGRTSRVGSVTFDPSVTEVGMTNRPGITRMQASASVDDGGGGSVIKIHLNDLPYNASEGDVMHDVMVHGQSKYMGRSKSTTMATDQHRRGMSSMVSWKSTRRNQRHSRGLSSSGQSGGRWGQSNAPTRVSRAASMHDYMFMDTQHADVAIDYNAESPDELGLVKAANELGFRFQGIEGGSKQMAVLYSSHPTSAAMRRRDGSARSNGSIRSGDVGFKDIDNGNTHRDGEGLFGHFAQPRVPGRLYRSEWERVAINEFSSKRKCMSILYCVPHNKNEYILFVKGADERVLPKCSFPGKLKTQKQQTRDQLNHYARLGLRTLVVAQKRISGKVAKKWLAELESTKMMSNSERKEKQEELANKLENGLSLLGVTAVEDRLQTGVPETIAKLRLAEIPLWVLTGDKVETAINIGYSSNLIDQKTMVAKVLGETEDQLIETTTSIDSENGNCSESARQGDATTSSLCMELLAVQKELGLIGSPRTHTIHRTKHMSSSSLTSTSPAEGEPSAKFHPIIVVGDSPQSTSTTSTSPDDVQNIPHDSVALVVDGKALQLLLAEEHGSVESQATLLAVARQCNVLIACRVSPSQKALLVRMVSEGVRPEPVTLAIGDGGNDVAMVQTASIGVGISGNEGNQAVNASDFSIAKFRSLQPLMLAHGRRNYMTMAKVVVLVIYANLLFTFGTFFFNFESGFSGQPIFNEFWYTFWNAFVAVPTILIGFFDRDMSARTMAERPELYHIGPQNLMLNRSIMVYQVVSPFAHAFVVYVLAINYNNGIMAPLAVVGSTLYLALVAVITARSAFTASTFTKSLVFAILFNFLFSFLAVVIYNRLVTGNTLALTRVGSRLVWLPVPLCTFLVVVVERLGGGVGMSVRERMMRQKWRIFHGSDMHAGLLCACMVPVVILACIVWTKQHAEFLTNVTA